MTDKLYDLFDSVRDWPASLDDRSDFFASTEEKSSPQAFEEQSESQGELSSKESQ